MIDRELSILLIGAGIALFSSITTSLASELIKYLLEKRRRMDENRLEVFKSREMLNYKFHFYSGQADESKKEVLSEIEHLAKKPIKKLNEYETIRFKTIIDLLLDDDDLREIAKMSRETEPPKNS